MSAINRGSITKQLEPGLNYIMGLSYGEIDNEHAPLFEIENSSRAFEEEVMFSMFGEAPTKAEGASLQYDDAEELWTSRYTHETIALGFAITEEALEDNQYDTFSKLRAKALGRSMASTKQTKAASVFNNGFSSSYTGGDGVALFSASHPTVAAGNLSNYTNTDLSETAVENAHIAIAAYKDDRGILIGARPLSLHIPSDLQFTAHKILNSTLTTTPLTNVAGSENVSNANDVNAVRSMGVFPRGVFVNHRFTDTDAWFVKTDVPNGTKMFVRAPLQSKMEGDFDTGNMRYKVRERYSFGWSDWRGFYGSEGA
jgi:hypothetical protein